MSFEIHDEEKRKRRLLRRGEIRIDNEKRRLPSASAEGLCAVDRPGR
jgi:hypothetical protein